MYSRDATVAERLRAPAQPRYHERSPVCPEADTQGLSPAVDGE